MKFIIKYHLQNFTTSFNLQMLFLISTSSNYIIYKNFKAEFNFIELFLYIIKYQIIEEINNNTRYLKKISQSLLINILLIISKYIVKNEPVLQYFSIINLKKCNANSIMKDIKIFLNAKVFI